MPRQGPRLRCNDGPHLLPCEVIRSRKRWPRPEERVIVTHGYVFGYGSLLDPGSLNRSLPGADPTAVIPAEVAGLRRVFDVAFPNDGSQPDKTYLDQAGRRPPQVLFANLRSDPDTVLNGALVPVTPAHLDRLRERERRYDAVELDPGLLRCAVRPGPHEPVLAFVGKAEFTTPRAIRAGVVPRAYLDTILAGARYWSTVNRGFLRRFHESTTMPARSRILELTRLDHVPAGPTPG